MSDDTHDYKPDKVYHPRETLREWLDAQPDSFWIDAKRFHMDVVAYVINGGNITTWLAGCLKGITGVDASFWLNLQRQYDEAHGND